MIDEALSELKRVKSKVSSIDILEANECETRKLVIDDVLEKVLGWDPVEDIKYEERVSEDSETTFADYIIRTASTAVIIEAKRAGKAFQLPINRKTGKLGGVLSKGDVGEAIRQARDYARKKSIPFAAVTNGLSWIIFPAVRVDGVSFEDTQAHIFSNLDDVETRFVSFWELFSRQRVVEGGLESALFGTDPEISDRNLLSIFKEPGYRLGRNCIYEHIEPAISIALTDEAILDDVEGLKFCYVKSSERIKYDSRLQMHLADVKPSLERKAVRPRRNNPDHLDETIEASVSRQQQFILVLGPVGAGKTTFLNYTRKVSAAESINGKILWLYIDFKRATESDNPRTYIYQELLRLIEEDREFNLGDWDDSIQPAYQKYMDNLARGSLAPLAKKDESAFLIEISKRIDEERTQVEPFVKRILNHAAEKLPGFIVIDNVDQIESDAYQRSVFIEAQAIARNIGLSAIMSLRDATYLNHRHSPVFDAFQVDSIYIDPPQVTPVLSRRFSYAKSFVSGKKVKIIPESGKTFIVEDLSNFWDILAQSLLSEKVGYLLEVLSGGDIRRGLAMVREFLSSGHTSADQALATYMTGKARFFPHEVLKGILLGQRQYYAEADSILLNIFDSKLPNKSAQLLRLSIINKLVSHATSSTFNGIPVSEIVHDLYVVGIPEQSVLDVLNALKRNRLIWTDNRSDITSKSVILPTRLAGYLVKVLAADFIYFESCMIDSRIHAEESWDQLCDFTHQIDAARGHERTKLRIMRAQVYLDYLLTTERHWLVNTNRYKIKENWGFATIDTHLKSKLNAEFELVLNRSSKKYSNHR